MMNLSHNRNTKEDYNIMPSIIDDRDSLEGILDFINILIRKINSKKVSEDTHEKLVEAVHNFHSQLMRHFSQEEGHNDLKEIVASHPEMRTEMLEIIRDHNSLLEECDTIIEICDNLDMNNVENIKLFEEKFKAFKVHLRKHDNLETNFFLDSMNDNVGAID